MSSSVPANKRYRPSLTVSEIEHAILLAKSNPSDASYSLLSRLVPFLAKITVGSISAAYDPATGSAGSASQSLTLEQQLGIPTLSVAGVASKEEYWKDCYQKYEANPDLCTIAETAAAKEHMYLNDLMTMEEEFEFEQSKS